MKTLSDYISLLTQNSRTEQNELLVDLLKYYNVSGTKDISLEQAAEFCSLFYME